jgi:hypothetical protein
VEAIAIHVYNRLFVIGLSPITLERQKRKSSTIKINPVEFEENRSSLMQSALESHIFNPHAISSESHILTPISGKIL